MNNINVNANGLTYKNTGVPQYFKTKATLDRKCCSSPKVKMGSYIFSFKIQYGHKIISQKCQKRVPWPDTSIHV